MRYKVFFAICVLLFGTFSIVEAQTVEFRLETTDTSGSVIDTINVGEEFVLSVFTRQSEFVGAPERGGLFSAFLDVSYDASLASIAGSVQHGPSFQAITNADLDEVGLLDNVGGGISNLPFVRDSELLLWSLLMQADDEGLLSLVGSASNVLLFEVVTFDTPSRLSPDLRFGRADLTIVPEPSGFALLLVGWLTCFRRFAPSRRWPRTSERTMKCHLWS